MSTSYSCLNVRQDEAVTVVELRDRRLIDAQLVARVSEQIRDVIENAEKANILICFDRVEYLSSSMLSELLIIDNLIRTRGGRLVLSSISDELMQVFTMTHLDDRMKICPDTAEALEAFA